MSEYELTSLVLIPLAGVCAYWTGYRRGRRIEREKYLPEWDRRLDKIERGYALCSADRTPTTNRN